MTMQHITYIETGTSLEELRTFVRNLKGLEDGYVQVNGDRIEVHYEVEQIKGDFGGVEADYEPLISPEEEGQRMAESMQRLKEVSQEFAKAYEKQKRRSGPDTLRF